MNFTIITPEKTVFRGDVEYIQLPGAYGLMGVLKRHAPIITSVTPGTLTIKINGNYAYFFVDYGFFEFQNNKGIILADTAEALKDIDKERADKALNKAKERLKSKDTLDTTRARRSLKRARARLNVLNKLK